MADTINKLKAFGQVPNRLYDELDRNTPDICLFESLYHPKILDMLLEIKRRKLENDIPATGIPDRYREILRNVKIGFIRDARERVHKDRRWCITVSEIAFEGFSLGGTYRFFLLLRDDFRRVDSYGESIRKTT